MPATISPTMAAPASLPNTMEERPTGNVSRVSRVLFSFSIPMEEMTMLPAMMMTSTTISGTTTPWEDIKALITPGLTPTISFPLKSVLWVSLKGARMTVELLVR